MAGFEVIVRPVVLPNIRPALARVLPPVDDPTQGFAVISGSSGKVIDLSRTWSVSVSRSLPQRETKRQVDEDRIYQMEFDAPIHFPGQGTGGKINKNNYVDVERVKKIRLDNDEGATKVVYADPPPAENVERIATDVTRQADTA